MTLNNLKSPQDTNTWRHELWPTDADGCCGNHCPSSCWLHSV